MAGPYTPNDNFIGPIIHNIAVIIKTGIPSITTVYEDMPDRAPVDNSVVLPLTDATPIDETNGKLQVKVNIGGKHLFRRKEMSANIVQAYSYLQPWMFLLAAWPNQDLGGLARSITMSKIRVTQAGEAGTPFLALAIDFTVLTEFNIPLL